MPKTTCLACGQGYNQGENACPRCLVAVGATKLVPVSEGGPAQLVRVYERNSVTDATKAFTKEAAMLAKVGWKVQSQSIVQGRSNAGINRYSLYKPKTTSVSVVYEQVERRNSGES